MNNDEFAVLWSPHQNAFHVESVGEMLETNRRIFIEQEKGDFVVLAFTESHEKAAEIRKVFQAMRDENT